MPAKVAKVFTETYERNDIPYEIVDPNNEIQQKWLCPGFQYCDDIKEGKLTGLWMPESFIGKPHNAVEALKQQVCFLFFCL